MNSDQQPGIAAEVLAALEANQLDLPTLPDVARRIRDALDDPNVSADQLVNLLSADPAISAHIIKVANSAAFAGGNPVDNLRGAIYRLGYRMLYTMIMTITMDRLFQAASPLVKQRLNRLWMHSCQVAANCYVLAAGQKHLKPEQAMLAGLVHDIGALPLCIYADRHQPPLDDAGLDDLLLKFQTDVGVKLLQNWNFPNELVDAVAAHENLQRTGASALADYADVLTVANLQMQGTAKIVPWDKVAAAVKLGIGLAECQTFLTTNDELLKRVLSMLGMNAPKSEKASEAAREAPHVAAKTSPAAQQKSGLLTTISSWFS